METAMSMSMSALKSIGSVPGSHFLLLGWGTSNFSSLCQRHSVALTHVQFGHVCMSICCLLICHLGAFGLFFPHLTHEPKQNSPMFFQMGTVTSRSPSKVLLWSSFSLSLFLSLNFFLLTPSTQACGVGITGLNGRLCGSLHLFMQV